MLTLAFTGCPGAGKSTLAAALAQQLREKKIPVTVFDGDQYRLTLNKDLGFSEADRRENIRRLMDLAFEAARAGNLAIVAAINPFEDQRLQLQQRGACIVYIQCSMATLRHRDPKGLYRRALLPDDDPNKINNLTGVNDRYDIPVNPDLVINTDTNSEAACIALLLDFVTARVKTNG